MSNVGAARAAALLRGECAELLAGPPAGGPRRAAAYRLLRAAENLELFSALTGPGRGPGEGRCADLAAAALALGTAVREVMATPPALFALEVCPGPLPVAAGWQALALALLNLVCNSLLYGGARPALRLRVFALEGAAVAEVRDAGPGVPPWAQRRAFAPFSAAGDPAALGLGLPLAAAFARRQGGAFLLTGRPGGTAAALALPLCPGAQPAPAPTAAELLADRYSPVYVQLSPRCVLPD